MRTLSTIRVRSTGTSSIATTAGSVAAGSVSWTSFTPALTAASASPDRVSGITTVMGETMSTQAAYLKLGDIIVARYQFVYGVGSTSGSGMYFVEFPPGMPCVFGFEPSIHTGNLSPWWPIIGEGTIYDSVNNKVIYVLCWASGTTNNAFAMRTSRLWDGSAVIEGAAANPSLSCNFAAGSFIKLQVWYPSRGYGGMLA